MVLERRFFVTGISTKVRSSALVIIYYTALCEYVGFRGVVVITSALHAEGPRFEPGRNQRSFCDFFSFLNIIAEGKSISAGQG